MPMPPSSPESYEFFKSFSWEQIGLIMIFFFFVFLAVYGGSKVFRTLNPKKIKCSGHELISHNDKMICTKCGNVIEDDEE